MDLAANDQNLDFEDQNTTSKDQNLDFGGERIKSNSVDAIGIINRSTYSNSIRKTLTAIFDRFFNEEFSRADIVSYPNASKSASTNYISYLQNLNVVERQGGGPFAVSEKAERDKRISLKPGRYV